MEEIGRLLRETREKLGLTHAEVERATRIRTRYLEAMERGDISSLPSSVQARGFLHNYADYLGLDPDKVLLEYSEKLRGTSSVSREAAVTSSQEQSQSAIRVSPPRWITTDLLVAMGIILAVLVLLVWGGSRLAATLQEQAAQPTEPVGGINLLSTSSPTPEPTATTPPEVGGLGLEEQTSVPQTEGTLPPELTGGEGPEGAISLRLLVERRSYIEVFVDGEQIFQGRAAPGDILEYQGEQLFRVVTGNGGGVRVVYNGQDQGRLGEIGEVVTRLWDLEGAITPTPTPSSTPSATPELEATETPNSISSPSP
ncbi:MAG: helix-turn-helix domain-containing protein [Anaerolineales bacterium]